MNHACVLSFAVYLSLPAAAAPEVELARGGRALLPVVTAGGASDRVREAAADLAEMLGKISGGTFEVATGEGASGIAVGTAADFPALALADALAVRTMADRETYLLRSHSAGLHVIGATELAVEDAVWDLLHRLGYRQFFPGATWEVVPSSLDLSIAADGMQKPDWYSRRIWYGYGNWDYNAGPYAEWCLRNRARAGFALHTGHAYGALIRRNRKAFDNTPEFYGLVGDERKSSKMCIGNPALRQLIVDYAVKYFEENPEADSTSMDPSDGGGWCECPACAKLGSITDRALTLSNAVAEAINRTHRDKYVGLYAYNFHSPPPDIQAHPNVIISIATAFIKGGFTIDRLIAGWSEKANMLGVREYYSVNVWDRDMPGKSRGSNLEYLARTIPDFHAKSARFMSSESSDNWGPNGLGYYVAARMLWDVDEAKRVDELVDDFLTRAFGPAKEPMAAFYELIDGANRWLVFDDLMGRMYRRLGEAGQLADSPQVKARIDDLILYARYVELFNQYSGAKGDARQQAFEALIRHAYRMRKTMMVHTKALYRDLVNRDKNVSIPEDCTWTVAEEQNPWKTSEPFTQAELDEYVSNGVDSHPLVELDFEQATYSDELVPATPLRLSAVALGQVPAGRYTQTFYTWVEAASSTIELRITGGLIAHYRDRGNVRIDLHKLGGASETGERETFVAHDESVPPDGEERPVRLQAEEPGLHRITVNDGGDMTRVSWDAGVPMTVLSSHADPARLGSRYHLYFYVPRGADVVGMYASGRGDLRDGEGNVLFTFDGTKADYLSVPVPEGQDGRLWKLHHNSGQRRLMNVPPYLARSAEELLLPREVVERDQ